MIDIVIATGNAGKIREIEHALDLPFIRWVTKHDVSEWPEIEETGVTFQANAALKAEGLSAYFKKAALADDSGLEVDALLGEPGVLSARFAGPDHDDVKNYMKVLDLLADVPEELRTARFKCVIAFAEPGEETVFTEGTVEGYIGLEPKGTQGFGYDPIFIPEGFDKTMAELGLDVKNSISHRGKALAAMRDVLVERFER